MIRAQLTYPARICWPRSGLLNVAWVLTIAVPTMFLPRFWAICYSFAWAFGHAAGVLVWLVYPFAFGLGYWTLYWYCPPVALSFVLAARKMFTIPAIATGG